MCNDICHSFKKVAYKTWNFIGTHRKFGRQPAEETITDINILKLLELNPHKIRTYTFTKKQESQNGADWEWWFHYQSQWMCIRVQAKVLNLQSNAFKALHYLNGQQTKNLITDALANPNFPKIPLYCLYLQYPPMLNCLMLELWCYKYRYWSEMMGCSIMSAFDVLQLGNKNKLKDVISFLRPWHSLVCCECYGINENPLINMQEYVKDNFLQYGAIQDDAIEDLEVNIPANFIMQHPPQYVLEIYKQSKGSNEMDEIKVPDANLGEVMIISLSNDDEFKNSND